MPPTFVINAVRCTKCNDPVYATERIDYDNKAYHTNCFRCLECNRVITVSQVAQLNGQIYDKNCFKKIFLKEGKYTTFQTLKPNDFVNAIKQQNDNNDNNIVTQDINNNSSNNSDKTNSDTNNNTNTNTNNTTSTSSLKTSNSIQERMAAFQKDKANTLPTNLSTNNNNNNNITYNHILLKAIQNNKLDDIQQYIQQYGLHSILQPIDEINNKTVIEYIFSSNNEQYKTIGRMLTDILYNQLQSSQTTIQSELKSQPSTTTTTTTTTLSSDELS